MSTHRIVDAQSIGLDAQKVSTFLARVKKEVEEGLLPAAQVAIARDGKVGVFESSSETSVQPSGASRFNRDSSLDAL